jgi:hypothetical protein
VIILTLGKLRTGLATGIFFAIVHAIWAIAILILPTLTQKMLDWIFIIHFLEPIYKITSVSFLQGLLLIIMTFVVGFVIGWVFAAVYNLVTKKK